MQDQVEVLKCLGNKALVAENYKEAIEKYNLAIQIDPKNSVLWSNKSAAHAKTGDYTMALQDARKAVELAPSWSKAHSRVGSALYGLALYEDAIKAYETALSFEPESVTIKKALQDARTAMEASKNPYQQFDMNLIMNLVHAQRWPSVRYNQPFESLRNNPEFESMMNAINSDPTAVTRYGSNPLFLEYLRILKQCEETETPPSPPTKPEEPKLSDEVLKVSELKQRGNEEYALKNFSEAMRYYDEALAMDPNNYLIKLNRASVMIEQQEYDGAIQYCLDLYEEERSNRANFEIVGKTLAKIGNAYFKQDKFADAIEYYNRSLMEHRNPSVLSALRTAESKRDAAEKQAYIDVNLSIEAKEQGNAYYKQCKYPEAVQSYTEAIKRDPSNPLLLTNRATTFIKLGALPSAIKDCDEALKLDSKLSKAYLLKGHAYQLMKDYSKAIEAFDQGLKIDPNNLELEKRLNASIQALDSTGEGKEEESTEKAYERALRNPEVAKILQDPTMQQILRQMSSDPSATREFMKNPEIARKISLLKAYKIIRFS